MKHAKKHICQFCGRLAILKWLSLDKKLCCSEDCAIAAFDS